MFDRTFFSTILPEHVRAEVTSNPGHIPIIELHLVSGAVLDLCHVVRVADTWVAVVHFCREDAQDDTDIAFLPYGTITRVSLTLRDENERQLGFSMSPPPLDVPADVPVKVSAEPPHAVAESVTSKVERTE